VEATRQYLFNMKKFHSEILKWKEITVNKKSNKLRMTVYGPSEHGRDWWSQKTHTGTCAWFIIHWIFLWSVDVNRWIKITTNGGAARFICPFMWLSQKHYDQILRLSGMHTSGYLWHAPLYGHLCVHKIDFEYQDLWYIWS
jgi:hypothetical protein